MRLGIDIGGTFTDGVFIAADGSVTSSKVASTPPEFDVGFQDALAALLSGASDAPALLTHGTTVATNTLVQSNGAAVGLITTAGQGDVLSMMRGAAGRVAGVPLEKVLHFCQSDKPSRLVPHHLVREVDERVDCNGSVVVPLDERGVERAVAELRAAGAESICVAFLWSFLAPGHERRAKEIAHRVAPGTFVTCSHEVAARWGEYERFAAAAIDAYVGPRTANYLSRVERASHQLGIAAPFRVMLCQGGVGTLQTAVQHPLMTLQSGPVAGVAASRQLATSLGYRNVIATDMGGTSFDVGIVVDGEPLFSSVSVVNQYRYAVPSVLVESIGAGGGSIAWVDDVTSALHVGPQSAGAVPGPACYGRGGTSPTVTDADLFLGLIKPETFLEGRQRVDTGAAESALSELARRLGRGLVETAAGVRRIVDAKMADLIRKATIRRGLDPRDFLLVAYGGAGPVHAAAYARELGVGRVVIPLGNLASVWSALGCAAADLVHLVERPCALHSPIDLETLGQTISELTEEVRQLFAADGADPEGSNFQASVEMRYRAQIHTLEVILLPEDLTTPGGLESRFDHEYEARFGIGAGYAKAGTEVELVRVRGVAVGAAPIIDQTRSRDGDHRESRAIYWLELNDWKESPVLNFSALASDGLLEGPAIVDLGITSAVIPPGARARALANGSIEIEIGGGHW